MLLLWASILSWRWAAGQGWDNGCESYSGGAEVGVGRLPVAFEDEGEVIANETIRVSLTFDLPPLADLIDDLDYLAPSPRCASDSHAPRPLPPTRAFR